MSVFITFAAALLIFGAVIAIHEFGHFAVAKLCGVQVNEFSIGMNWDFIPIIIIRSL